MLNRLLKIQKYKKFFEMEKTRSQKQLGICSDIEEKLEDADYVIIATPTNLNHQTGTWFRYNKTSSKRY